MICIDTSVLIWGVQGTSSAGQEEMVERTSRYVRFLAKSNEKVMVPAPVLAEYLAGFPAAKRAEQVVILQRLFFVPAFDAACAIKAAALQDLAKGHSGPPEVGRRNVVKADTQIAACAMIHNADQIVTGEPEQFAKLCEGAGVRVTAVPNISEQTLLDFDSVDDAAPS